MHIEADIRFFSWQPTALSTAMDAASANLQARGLEVERSARKVRVSGDGPTFWRALPEVRRRAAEEGVALGLFFPGGEPVPGWEEGLAAFEAIGWVKNDFDRSTPMDLMLASESRVVLEPALLPGLKGWEPGDPIVIIFYFHRSQGYALQQHPRGNEERAQRGVFDLRSPHRPNAIGVTRVDLLAIEGNVLRVRGLDAINGTPVLDLKPQW